VDPTEVCCSRPIVVTVFGSGAALVSSGGVGLAWPLLPVLSHCNAAGVLVYVAVALLLVGVPLTSPLETLAVAARTRLARLAVYALAGGVAGGLVGGAFLMPGLAFVGAMLGVYLSATAAWVGPRLRRRWPPWSRRARSSSAPSASSSGRAVQISFRTDGPTFPRSRTAAAGWFVLAF
jgi:hypothetical protein